MYTWRYPLYILIISLQHFTNSQKQTRGRTCLTAINEQGSCINIKQCSYMYNLLRTQSNHTDATIYLQKSKCGYEGGEVKICCPTTPATSSQRPSPPNQPNPPNQSNAARLNFNQMCGVQLHTENKIVNGHEAMLGDWPWIAALGYRNNRNPGPEWYCGSTLINNRYVITAAHCILETPPWILYLVRLGDLHLDDRVNDGATPVDIAVENTYTHEKYSSSPITNDIALVRLKRTVQFTPLIMPICLPTMIEFRTNSLVNEPAFVAGWGRVNFTDKFSPALQDLRLPIIDNAICKRQYDRLSGSKISNKMICAGFMEGKQDACQGDSGGPLVYLKNGTFYLIGIVSYGYRCAQPGFPGIYTRVSEFLDWIATKATK